MSIDFAHLHCHTIYSIQDAIAKLKDYVNVIYEQNQAQDEFNVLGFALTDHGIVSGYPDMYDATNNPDQKEKKTKAIYGVEIYHCLDVDKNPNHDRFHLCLLAKNNEGLKNIYRISSHAGLHLLEGKSKSFPITDLKKLKECGKGIIASSACLGGIIPQYILNGETDKAIDMILEFNSYFDEFYLEVQPTENSNQLIVNAELVKLSEKMGVPLIITSDSHYIYKEQQQYHNILKQIAHQLEFDEPAYLRSPIEMKEYCIAHNIPLSAISNTGEIAKKCNADPSPASNREYFPEFPCPNNETPNAYLRKLAIEGLKERLIENGSKNPTRYIKQLLYELEVICNQGYASYFLILSDWLKWCRANDILAGPGRGSGAGSLVTYSLRITNMDPILNGFTFERFLSPERASLPDIDQDIPTSKRAKAIQYFVDKYGADKVSQIVTFGKYKLKNLTKDTLSAYGCDFKTANDLTKNIPTLIDGKEVDWDLIEGVHNDRNNDKYSNFTESEIQKILDIYDKYQEIFNMYPQVYDAVKQLGGCYKSTGAHAGGVIVSSKPLTEYAQVFAPTHSAVLPVLQFDMHAVEFYYFLKIDALGLSTLDVIKETMDLVGLDYSWYDSEDYNDDSVYEMLRNGETTDIFQMAGFMSTKLLSDFKVDSLKVINAVNAGNRPGPLEKDPTTGKSMVDLYAERRNGAEIPSINEEIDSILSETQGCIWYQEQCMELGREIAGYSMGNADARIRKVLGKKKVKMIPEIRNEFIYGKKSVYDDNHNVIGLSDEPSDYCTGAVNNGYSVEVASEIFKTIEAFAKYSFNKAHSGCYAKLGYKTAYLSKHYPVEFAVANCTVNDEEEKIVATLSLAKKRGIKVLGPDINKSKTTFSCEVDNGVKSIRYGLKAIKGIGIKVIDFIEKYRQMDGNDFSSFDDFYTKVHDSNSPIVQKLMDDIRQETNKNSPNPLKKDVEKALILSGAFDFDEPNRFKLLNHYMVDIRGEKDYKPKKEKDYIRKEKLALEKEYMGTYVSEHPLDPFTYQDFKETPDGQAIKSTYVVTEASLKTTKTGKKYLSIKGYDKLNTQITVNLFNEEQSLALRPNIKKNAIVIVTGKVSHTYNNINADSVKICVKKPIDTEDMEVKEYDKKPQEDGNNNDTVVVPEVNILETMFDFH